ncbi:rho GTPase-activating protein 11A [Biomphalaria glabrata]
MEDSRFILINGVQNFNSLYLAIYKNIRELGVKLPKVKKLNKLNQSRRSLSASSLLASGQQDENLRCKIFGEPLYSISTNYLPNYGYVPEFLVKSCEIIDQHLESEGVFRKSGSVCRQKELRFAVEDGKSLDGANVFDTAVLIKQFFRELPEPLFLTIFLDALIRCYQLPPDKDPKKAILQLCLLLPLENIGTLRYTMHMLYRVAARCDKNKMTANNLALIMAPNIMHNNKGTLKMSSSEEKLLHIQTYIVELLIKNWDQIGIVTSSLQHQMGLLSEGFATDDDLDASDDNTLEESKNVSKKIRRKRSGSLTDLVSSIAHGLSKLRRSTDGKGGNMSLNSSQKGEVSITSFQPSTATKQQTQEIPADAVTPCVMRKRRASGDTVPFSTSKKQAILGYLPQKSALASTPFTPSSTLTKNQVPSAINVTTPAIGSKSRKKLSLFLSPGSRNKTKEQTSTSLTSESPPDLRKNKPLKSKNIFKRLSGSRTEKVSDDVPMPRSVSSPTLNEVDYRADVVSSLSLPNPGSCHTTSLQSLLSADSLLSLDSGTSHDMSESVSAFNISPDSGKGSMLGESSYDFTIPSHFMSTHTGKFEAPSNIDQVTHHPSIQDQNPHQLEQSHGLTMLCENYLTSDEDDSSNLRNHMVSREGSHLNELKNMPKKTNISRNKSVSAEDLQSGKLKVDVPVRVHSLHEIPSKQHNVKPHLHISKQTHNMLARAGYISPTSCDSNEIHMPVKSPKRLGYREELMLSLRSSLHERHSHNNHLFRSLRGLPDSSSTQDGNHSSNYIKLKKDHEFNASGSDEGVITQEESLLSKERHLELSLNEVMETEVDVTGIEQDLETDVDVTGLEKDMVETDVDVTGLEKDMVETDVDVTGLEKDMVETEVDVTGLDVSETSSLQNNAMDVKLDVTTITDSDKLTNQVSDTEFDVTSKAKVIGNVADNQPDKTDIEMSEIDNAPDIEMDITNDVGIEVDLTNINTSKDTNETNINQTDANILTKPSVNETNQAPVINHSLKDIKASLTLSGILDQEIVNQVEIKRAEVLLQKRESVLNISHAGLVAQSIKQFNAGSNQGQIKPLVPKRGTSPIRIPKIFTKTSCSKSPLKESNSSLLSTTTAGNGPENELLQAAIKTPLKLLNPVSLKTPTSTRTQRPHIKRLKVHYSPRKINHRSPKLGGAVKSPSGMSQQQSVD